MGYHIPVPYNTRKNARVFRFFLEGYTCDFHNPTIIPKLLLHHPNGVVLSQCRTCGRWLEYPDDFVKSSSPNGKRCYRRQCKQCWVCRMKPYWQRPEVKAHKKKYFRQYYLERRVGWNDYKKRAGYVCEHSLLDASDLPSLKTVGV